MYTPSTTTKPSSYSHTATIRFDSYVEALDAAAVALGAVSHVDCSVDHDGICWVLRLQGTEQLATDAWYSVFRHDDCHSAYCSIRQESYRAYWRAVGWE